MEWNATSFRLLEDRCLDCLEGLLAVNQRNSVWCWARSCSFAL